MTAQIEDLVRRIESAGDTFTWSGPQSDGCVADLATALGVTLPPSYRQFLRRYGAGGVQAIGGISGVWDGDARLLSSGSAFGDTSRFRDQWGLPVGLVVIDANHGYEAEFPPACLDTSRKRPDGECPVVHYSVLARRVVPPEYPTFADFLASDLSNTLDALLDVQDE